MAGKRILVAEDNEILRNGMRTILEGIGYDVVEANNGKAASEMLGRSQFDLIVSDDVMPEMDGIELLGHAKAKGSIRFLMMAALDSQLQSRQAARLGADQFINKPFSKDDFIGAVESAMGKDVEAQRKIEWEYVAIPIADFISGSALTVDLYLRLSSTKYLKVGRKGGQFSDDRAKKYFSKGTRWFYMRKDDFAEYVGFNINLAQSLHHTKLETSRKLLLTMHVTETLIAQMRSSGVKRDLLEEATNVVGNAVELISMNPDTLSLLENIENPATPLPSHSISVAIWASLIAKQLEWAGQSTYFKVAMGALFHDIGQDDATANSNVRNVTSMNPSDRKFFESHTLRGNAMMQALPGVPEDVALVALQHHERADGSGYPHQLKFHQISPLARLIGLADQFCDFIREQGMQKGSNFRAAYSQMLKRAHEFDPAFLAALGRVLDSADAAAEQAKGESA